MRNIMGIFTLLLVSALSTPAQVPTFRDTLLDHMTGAWVLEGEIAGRNTTHDVDVACVLGHQYMVSREKDGAGQAAYEATVFIGRDDSLDQYACLWLDNTGGGGLKGQAIAHAKRDGDAIAFLLTGSDGSLFHTTFACRSVLDRWEWIMDGEEGGKLRPFARVTLRRKR